MYFREPSSSSSSRYSRSMPAFSLAAFLSSPHICTTSSSDQPGGGVGRGGGGGEGGRGVEGRRGGGEGRRGGRGGGGMGEGRGRGGGMANDTRVSVEMAQSFRSLYM